MTDTVASFTDALAGEIRSRMGRRNLTGSQLSEKAGMSNPTLSRSLRGDRPFRTDELEAVAKALDTSIQGLIMSVRS